jgi:hypothetical protein
VALTANAAVVRALLGRHGRTYAEEAGISVDDSAAATFQVLSLSLLLSARIRAAVAVRAASELINSGWGRPDAMSASTWEARVAVLDRAGYARYDERTARQLGRCAAIVLGDYGGDLGRIRERADRRRSEERRLLQQFPGIGPLGVTIFAREIQATWTEWYPFADKLALDSAALLGLPDDVRALEQLAGDRATFVRLVAALVRSGLARDHEDVVAQAGVRGTSTS